MSARWIDYWESYGMPHDDKSKDNIQSEDFILKGKYTFLNKAFKLSGKTIFNTTKSGLTNVSDYTLTHNVSPVTSYMVIHKPNKVTLDGNFKLWSKDDVMLSLYANSALEQNIKDRNLPSKLHLRVHHQDNKIFGLGVEGIDPFNIQTTSPTLSAWGLYGAKLPHDLKAFGGAYVGFVPQTKHLSFHRYLLGLKHALGTAHLEFSVDRVLTETTSEGKVLHTVENQSNVSVKFDGKANNDLKVGGDVSYDFLNSLQAKLYGEYSLDSSTFVKAKVDTENTLSVSLTHNYKGIGLLGFTSKFLLVRPSAKSDERKVPFTHFTTKFGFYVELNENL